MTDKPDKEKKEYFLGEVVQEISGNRVLTEVIAKPDGTAMSDRQATVEILNKLDIIYSLVKNSL